MTRTQITATVVIVILVLIAILTRRYWQKPSAEIRIASINTDNKSVRYDVLLQGKKSFTAISNLGVKVDKYLKKWGREYNYEVQSIGDDLYITIYYMDIGAPNEFQEITCKRIDFETGKEMNCPAPPKHIS